MSKELQYLKPTMKIRWREAQDRELEGNRPYTSNVTGFIKSYFILEQWWESDLSGQDGKWIPIEVEQ